MENNLALLTYQACLRPVTDVFTLLNNLLSRKAVHQIEDSSPKAGWKKWVWVAGADVAKQGPPHCCQRVCPFTGGLLLRDNTYLNVLL